MKQIKKIGVFDSGVGGLDTLYLLQKKYPSINFIYLADNANLPYGDKKPEQIIEFSRQIIKFLISKSVDLIVVACNTSSAISVDILRTEFSIPIVDIITPIAEQTANLFQNIGMLATQGTVQSDIYKKKFQKINPTLEMIQIACPKLVPIIESGNLNLQKTTEILENYLEPIIKNPKIEALIYGCTHYHYLNDIITTIIPDYLKILNPALYISRHLDNKFEILINSHSDSIHLLSQDSHHYLNKIQYFSTGEKHQLLSSMQNLNLSTELVDFKFADLQSEF
jgi:glutamate racemase